MAKRKFEISFRPTSEAEDITPLTLILSPIDTKKQDKPAYSHLSVVPYHPSSEVTSSVAADCHLQIWELDRFKVDRFLSTEESDIGAVDNRLVATFPGVVEIVGGKYKFRPAGDPVFERRVVDPLNGLVTVKLQPTNDTAEINYTVPLPEYEGVLELAGVLRTDTADRGYATQTTISPRQVRNVQAALRRQIDEWGGIAVAFVTDYSEASAEGPIRAFPYQKSTTFSNNNAEFPRQAEDMIDANPTFIFRDGRVQMGYLFTNSYEDWPAILDTLRDEVAKLLGIRPPISVLEIYCHGIRKGCHINAAGYVGAGSINTTSAQDFVNKLSKHLSEHIVVPLFACNTGRSVYSGGNGKSDPTFATRRIGDEIGADAVAWTLQRKLQKAGHAHATVWGHTLAAHTTRNPYLAVYSASGHADIANVFRKADRLDADGVKGYFRQFAHSGKGISDELYRHRLHNANLLRILCLQNALYFPWAWHGGTDATAKAPGFNPRANRRARACFDELAGQFGGLTIKPDDFTFTPNRQYITGLRPGGDANPQVSEHFAYTAYSAFFPNDFISIRLARMVQLLRHRCNKGFTIDGLLEDGQGAWLKAAPNKPANLTAIHASAREMFDDALFTFMIKKDDRIQVSVSGVGYDPAGEYITSRHPDVPNPMLKHDLPYSAFQSLIKPFRLHRHLPLVMSSCMKDVQMSLTPKAIEDFGDTLVINAGTRGNDIVRSAEFSVALGTIARVTRDKNGAVVLSMK